MNSVIDPNPISYESISATKSVEAAQWWFLFAIIVAGKNAEFATKATNKLLALGVGETPFERLCSLQSGLEAHIRNARTGNYGKMSKAFHYLIYNIRMDKHWRDPRELSVDDMMCVPGVGPKTARWFRLLIDPNAKVAALDTHVLKFLRDLKGAKDVPDVTPAWGPSYRRWEAEFLAQAEALAMPPAQLDYLIWATYRNGGKITGLEARNQNV